MRVDYHVHTQFSDGRDTVYELLKEAKDSELEEVGLVDHCSPLDSRISHEGRVWDHWDGSEEDYSTLFRDNYRLRNEVVGEVVEDMEGVVMKGEGTRYPDPLEVALGVEIDYNPRIEDINSEKERQSHLEEYNSSLDSFVDEARSMEHGFHYLVGSVHYVNVDGEPLYVKKSEPFKDMAPEQKREVLDMYFEKAESMIRSEIFDIAAHLTLPERSDELMGALTTEDTRRKLWNKNLQHEKFLEEDDLYDIARVERRISSQEDAYSRYAVRNAEEEMKDASDRSRSFLEEFSQSVVKDSEAVKEREEILNDYYSDLKEPIRSSTTVPEINGKGVERQRPSSVFWSMVDDYTQGSDSHREGELSDRDKLFKQKGLEPKRLAL